MVETAAVRRRLAPDRETLLYGALLVNGEVALVLVYYAFASAVPTDAVFLAYPLVWVNVAAWSVTRVDFPDASKRARWLAAAVGVAYFLLLGGVGGLYHLGGMGLGADIRWLPPGWGPAVVYSGTALTVSLFPFKVVGYAALAYLVAATVVDASGRGLAGLLGLFSCVSCTWPVAATVLTGVFGSASAAATVATNQPYALSTVVFTSSVLLLAWRPRF
ncbi:MAG: ABC transporter ATP-binding protein [Halobacterium sp.]